MIAPPLRLGRVVLCLCLAAAPSAALSPDLSIRQYLHDSWTDNAGQPLRSVQYFAQTANGYLWLATAGDHLRFDGLRFSDWPLEEGQRLPSTYPRGLLAASDGSVWVAAEAGLSRVKGGRVTEYAFDLSRAGLSGLFEDPSGAVWMGADTPDGSAIHVIASSGEPRRYGPADGLPPRVLAIARDGEELWLGLPGAVCRWRPGAPAACRTVQGSVESLAPAAPGEVFAATPSAIYRVTPARIEAALPRLAEAAILPGRLIVDRDGNVWAGTSGGLLRLRNRTAEMFTRQDRLSGESIGDILEDAEGNIWVATNNGIDRFRNPRVLHFSRAEGLSGEIVTTVKATRDGSVWAGTLGAGLNRIRGGTVTRYSAAEGLPARTISALEEDGAGRLWVATGPAVARFTEGRFVKVAAPPLMQPVYALSADGSGRIWAAAATLWRIGEDAAEPVDAGQPADIFRVFPAREGSLWLGSYAKGVAILAGSRGGATALPGIAPGAPRQICEDSAGSMWVAAGSTLNRVRKGHVTTWGPQQGLSAGEINGVTVDRAGDVWISAADAVLRVALADLSSSPDGHPRAARFHRYDARDGLRPAERGGMPSPRITAAADGRIWVCERDGLAILDPKLLRPNRVPPPVVIEQLSIDGAVLRDEAPRFRGRQLRIVYTANSLMAPERVRFKYRLDPGPDAWTEAENRREVTFVNLPPGDYRFRVSACNLDGACNEAGAAAAFRVMPHFWQTIWFNLAAAAALAGMVWGGYRFRMRQVVRRFHLVAQERARVTREIHDSLLQGFAGVVLQLDAASRQFATNPTASKDRLDRALDQADQSLREARHMLLDMRLPILEDRTLVEALSEVGENAVRGAGIAFHVRARGAEKPLPYPAQAALFLIGREAITNAVNHARAGRITVHVVSGEKSCRLSVEDDGVGFDVEAAKRKAGHLGVQGMTERAREAGAELRIESAPGQGSRIEVVVPLSRA
jgi:signal transduction histidine kinase/ligand-binding sensor domain-containing protein